MITIDKLCYVSKLRYVNATEKVVFAILSLFIAVCSRSVPVAIIVILVNSYLIVFKSGVKFKRYCHFLTVPFSFMILSTISIIINFSPVPLDAFAIPIGSIYITSSVDSLFFALNLMITALSGVTCLYFMSFTTPITDILNVMKKAHLPALFIELNLLIYRYIFILLDVVADISTAQKARLGNKDFKTSVKSFTNLATMLFIRAMKKSSALFDAMESRGYDGVIRVLDETVPAKKSEILGIATFEILLISLLVMEKFV